MTPLERTLIEKAGHENGWENADANGDSVELFSARHRAKVIVRKQAGFSEWEINLPPGLLLQELHRAIPAETLIVAEEQVRYLNSTSKATEHSEAAVVVHTHADLERVLRCAAELAIALPNQPTETYRKRLAQTLATPPASTEVERLVKQRVGQDVFREALLAYWQGACAVTGVAVPEVLRASHAKPWASCATDDERLDVFNGFLLCAHLDALFDRGLITFADDGTIILSSRLPDAQAALLHLTTELRLRHIAQAHLPYLVHHREEVFAK